MISASAKQKYVQPLSASLLRPLPSIGGFKLALFLILFISSSLVNAQKTKSQLEKEKIDNLRKIAQAEKILTETQSEKQVNLGQLQAIDQQIKARESLITGLTLEIGLLDDEIKDLSIVVRALQLDLENLKEEYAAMIYSSFKANSGFNMLTYLFAAETFNQLFMRLKYLDQYAEARKTQTEQIEVVAEELDQQRGEVQIKRNEQDNLLKQQLRESRKLAHLKSQKSTLITELNKKEKQLRREVLGRKKAIDRLDATIASIVKDELNNSNNASSVTRLNLDELTAAFEQEKRKLQWPVAAGFISKKFGTRPHPVLKRIKTENNGVDIQTNGEESVRTVHSGEVKMVGYLQGMNNFVMVKHGKYFTVYSRLKNVKVKKGQKLTALDPIGEVFTDADGISEVHFEVWKNTEKLDPEKWLIQ